MVASAPPKRSKMSRIAVKTRRVQPIERDEHGQPKLPQQIGVLTVLSLGRIVYDRDTFHNERYIFPVGYTVRRTYPSMIDPTTNTIVTSTILEGTDGPRFEVTAADMPDQPIVANSATGAWTVVVRRSNEIRNREHSNSASGPDYYGFKHPTIAKLIQDLPGTEHLSHYVWQNFEEMEPRAAKGVMAAAEKKRGNLEQMGNANRRAPRSQLADGSASGDAASQDASSDMMDTDEPYPADATLPSSSTSPSLPAQSEQQQQQQQQGQSLLTSPPLTVHPTGGPHNNAPTLPPLAQLSAGGAPPPPPVFDDDEDDDEVDQLVPSDTE